jgi:primosomal protein N' (replication factor Y)
VEAGSARAPRPRPGGAGAEPVAAAAHRPVARVLVDSALPHLDRPFDYLVPEPLAATAQPGVRVRVRFAGRDLAGVVLDRVEASELGDRLEPLRRVVSPEPVLAPDVARLLRLVADRWSGTAADVLRLAVPPRHAAVERAPPAPAAGRTPPPDTGGWRRYPGGTALLAALAAGQAPRAVWTAASGDDWPDLLARALLATAAGGRGAVAVLPDARDVDRLDGALARLAPAGPPPHAVLTAQLGPRRRYRAFLGLRRGAQPIAVGTRAAAFAPVRDLGLVAVWDDGDDLLAEPRAPYPHARDVLLLRAHDQGCAVLLGGSATTPEATRLVQTGWARPVGPTRADARGAGPRVRVVDEHDLAADPAARSARLPSLAWRTAHGALAGVPVGRGGAAAEPGPVLVQVPRRGYLPAVACRRCRQPARCGHCRGPLRLAAAGAAPDCAWCGRVTAGWCCPACGGTELRAAVVGARRTAEELGRAFPGVVLRTSTGPDVLPAVGPGPALVVATPGAEPPAEGGYAAALLLDAWALLGLPLLRAGEEAVRRWLAATALVRPAAQGGRVVLVGAAAGLRPVQALLRADPVGFARAELADREAAGFPPAVRLAELTGAPADVAELLALADLPAGLDRLGPVAVAPPGPPDGPGGQPGDGSVRALLRVPHADGPALTAALHAAAAVRSARRSGRPVRVRVDPVDLG